MSERIRCAIYTRKSTEDGLDQEFNSLDAQREACEAFIQSQRGLGWVAQKKRYDDGGISGGTMDRPALQTMLTDIEKGKVDLVVVYKVDRLTRSLMDFAKIIETFDARGISFVSVTQQFNTANSMGRLTLNVLLSFAQFEREVTAERIRDKIAASKKKGMWMGGLPPLGYDAVDKKLVINEDEATVVRALFDLYLELGSVRKLQAEAERQCFATKQRKSGDRCTGGKPFTRGHLYWVLHNPVYVGEVAHKGKTYPGQHKAIVERVTWNAVQKMLDDRASSRQSPTNTKQNCILTGLVFDEKRDRLSPSYCRKGGRRYRYYISKRLLHGADKNDGWRIPADQLEQVILKGLCGFLEDNSRVTDAVHGAEASPSQLEDSIIAARGMAKEIKLSQSAEIVAQARRLIERVDIDAGQIRITVSLVGLSELVGGVNASDGGPIMLDLPIAIRRRGVESKIILQGALGPLLSDGGLVELVSDTYQWVERIAKGEITTVRDIARQEKVDEGDVSRFLALAFLAPDIVEAILAGRQPVELTPEKLKRLRNLPKSWEEQRQLLGFSG
jgi:site-specific DNA recombinase